MKVPYDDEGYAEKYEERYVKSPEMRGIIAVELSIIESLMENKNSWLDVGCGTGYLLRNADVDVERFGLDRSPKMLDLCRGDDITLIEEDLLKYESNRKYDVVTNFWYGYLHQHSLEEVKKFFMKMISLTEEGGSMFVEICNPWGVFDEYRYKWTSVFNKNDMMFDAIMWSSTVGGAKHDYENCLAPHPELIHNWIRPQFKNNGRIDYETKPNRFGFLFGGKI